MKTKYYLIPILLGTLVILYSITPKPVYAAEGGTYKSKEISCTCNYGPHANEQGKRNECSESGTGAVCNLIREYTWDPIKVLYVYSGCHYEPTTCMYCSYSDCSGVLCYLGICPE